MLLQSTCISRHRHFATVGKVLLVLLACVSTNTMAASIESLISPGPMSAAHAETESECSACHKPFAQQEQKQLCLECHEEIAEDLASAIKFHGNHPAVREQECRSCHTEHEGRAFDITGLVAETFDHNLTEFALAGGHATLQCASCHSDEVAMRDTPSNCVACHENNDIHRGGLGEECSSCHNPTGWSEVDFDHGKSSEFSLLGAHAKQPCSSCHLDQVYKDTPMECVACHKVDDYHQGALGDDCRACHNSENWTSRKFDHLQETGFELVHSHADLSCNACHLNNMELSQPPDTCVGCHSADDVHLGQRGTECGDCHTSKTWQIKFDHEQETGFQLAGAHSTLSCESCHGDNLTDSLPTDCEGCHEEDDPHSGSLGACDSCHNVEQWTAQISFDHEFTRFPLIGLHRLSTCDQCHDSAEFNTAPLACAECHELDDPHFGNFSDQCESCHNPGGWELWRFDHNTQTTFALSGAHENLVCAACHGENSGAAENQTAECISCHIADDQHNGQFGRNCEQCHVTSAFDEGVRFR